MSLKYLKLFNESSMDNKSIMEKAVEYHNYIDDMGEKLAVIIIKRIKPLMDKGEYTSAKEMVRSFYKLSRFNDEVIFLEYNDIIADISRVSKSKSPRMIFRVKPVENVNIDIDSVIKKSVEYYIYIDKMGTMLAKLAGDIIKPLLDEAKYKQAKVTLKDFFSSSMVGGYSVFIEHDLLLANIIRRENK